MNAFHNKKSSDKEFSIGQVAEMFHIPISTLRAFGDIRVTKLLFLNGILRKSHFPAQSNEKPLSAPPAPPSFCRP